MNKKNIRYKMEISNELGLPLKLGNKNVLEEHSENILVDSYPTSIVSVILNVRRNNILGT